MSLFDLAHACLRSSNPDEKLELTHAAASAWLPRLARGEMVPHEAAGPAPIEEPGRPPRPRLVLPRDVPQRKLSTPEGRAALLHAVVHIEFNAINLAWDAAYRFRGLPADYYADWIRVADDEARHFAMLRARLADLGYEYGDFDAHNGLWEMATKTADDRVARMALVPRVLEARGLDVTPGMIERLRSVGDHATAALLAVILEEEVAHVAAGSRWFAHGCREAGLDPGPVFHSLLARHGATVARGPFNRAARLAAGFSAAELDSLAAGAG
ncbi:MAG TPA: ferritin-like domain-containing protein [Candidatus Saccharimonadia bacterium]|nr:ferritin-like domain-containing protein [Candidatus Saccharimonadia bacterium]